MRFLIYIKFSSNLAQSQNSRSICLIVAKALDGQRYPLPLCEYMLMCDGERGSGPEGADDLCSVIFEDLGLKVSINNEI